MGALRLETFIPLPPTAKDQGFAGPDEIVALREAAYAEGVKAGASAASAAFEAEKSKLLAPILEALQDTILTRAEARAGALIGLRPLLDILSAAILPPLAYNGLIAEITQAIASAAEQAPDDILTLKLAPENVEGITAVLKQTPAEFSIAADSALHPLEARLYWAGGFDAIDLGEALNAAQAVCARFFAQPKPNTQNPRSDKPLIGEAHAG